MTSRPRVLLIDDDEGVCQAVEFRLRGLAELTACNTADAALERARSAKYDVALVDVNLGTGLSGIRLIALLREIDPDLAAIVFTAHSNYKTALDSFGAHSFDFIPKNLRDDGAFLAKINQGVMRTREQRVRSHNAVEAARLRSVLADTVANHELEVTNNDIQRGLLNESLAFFSSLLGQVELTDLYIRKMSGSIPALRDVVKLSEETVAELQDHVGKLRDYFSEPERATNSINEALAHAVAVMQDDVLELPDAPRIERGELNPDQKFAGDGRALLRAVVLLLRMMVKAAPEKSVFTLRPRVVSNPLTEFNFLKGRHNAWILQTSSFHRDEKTAVGIEISGPAGKMTADRVAALFSSADPSVEGISHWSIMAMIAKLNGALVVESKTGGVISFRIILKL